MNIKNTQDLIDYLEGRLTVEDLSELVDPELDRLEGLLYHWRELAAAEQNRRHASRIAQEARS